MWSLLTAAALFAGMLFTALVVLQAVDASGVDGVVSTQILPWWGVDFAASAAGTGSMGVGVAVPWWALLAPAVVFAVVAQPWRLLRGSPPDGSSSEP